MRIGLSNVFLSNSVMLVCSLIIGYSLWIMLSRNQVIQHTFDIPVHVYAVDGQLVNRSTLRATIEGPRAQIQTLDTHRPTVTVQLTQPATQQSIPIIAEEIHLPQTIALINYTPDHIALS